MPAPAGSLGTPRTFRTRRDDAVTHPRYGPHTPRTVSVQDELPPLEALPDGQEVAEVLEALGLKKSTLYKYAGELAIKPQTHRCEAWLSGAEVELLTTRPQSQCR